MVMLSLIVVGGSVYWDHSRLALKISSVFTQNLPINNQIRDIRFNLEETISSLTLFLLSQDPVQLENYQSQMTALKLRLNNLGQDPLFLTIENGEFFSTQIIDALEEIALLDNELINAANNPDVNLPALHIATTELVPRSEIVFDQIDIILASEAYEDSTFERRIALQKLAQLKENWLRMTNEYRMFLAFRYPGAIEKIAAYQQQIDNSLDFIFTMDDKGTLSIYQSRSLILIKQTYSDYKLNLERALTIHSSEQSHFDSYTIKNTIIPLIQIIDISIDQLLVNAQSTLTEKEAAILSDLNQSSGRILLLVISALLVGLGIACFTSWQILKRLKQTVSAMYEISDGDGNLETRLDESGSDEMSELAKSFNKFVSKINGIVELVLQSSSALMTEADTMLEVVSKTETGVENQRLEIEMITASVNRMNEKVEEIAENSSNAARSARDASSVVADGSSVVDNSQSVILELANEVEQAATVITQVEKESGDIGIVVSVIRDISDQTNLLALNAAIEAARAGEQGRGFAVVADEVRNLSNKIQHQTIEINNRIEALQQGSKNAVELMREGAETAKSSVILSRRAGEALSHINERVDSISETSTNIASATELQREVAKNIVSNIGKLSQISEETSAGAILTSSSAKEFKSLSEQLLNLVQEFLLNKPSDKTENDKFTSDETTIDDNAENDIFF